MEDKYFGNILMEHFIHLTMDSLITFGAETVILVVVVIGRIFTMQFHAKFFPWLFRACCIKFYYNSLLSSLLFPYGVYVPFSSELFGV